ncbi:hypothetical protein HF086_009974 [Spodoptera exigua]|uniref:Uncharacterized protein n=1 Tax=Spodoptera exigua TaxID=7107 RepID=A0A922SLP7_SPOEX|nr:hypothetical protein HF086_009974 [Spodoptera exigua]
MNTVFSIFIFLFANLLLMCSCADKFATAGSFNTSIISIRDCINPGKQFLKNPSMVYDTLLLKDDGKNMIGGNLTVLKDTRDIKASIHGELKKMCNYFMAESEPR